MIETVTAYHSRFRLSALLAVLAGMVLLGLMTSPARADILDTADPYAETEETVTDIEELAPGGQDSALPGAEPIYDQGVTVTVVEMEGNHHIRDREVLDIILTKPGSLYSKRRLKKDLQLLFDSGWFTDKLRAVPVATRDGIKVKYVLDENQLVTKIGFKGNTLVEDSELRALFKKQLGRPQNVNLINKGIEDVEGLYRDKGLVLSRVDDIDEPAAGEIMMTINEGTISSIEFEGNKKTKDKVVLRAMAQKVNEVYNEKVVADDMKRIFSTQAFSDVRRVVKADPNNDGKYILVMELDEKKTGAISLGGGIDTGTGLFGSLGYSDPNFRGRGQNISSTAMVGSGVIGRDRDTINRRIWQFQTSWFNPSISDDSLISMGADTSIREFGSFNVPLTIERRYGGELNFGRPIESMPGTSIGLGIGFENTNISEGASAALLASRGITTAQRAASGALNDGSFIYLAPVIGMDTRDNRLNPTDGWLNTIGAHAAMGLGNSSYSSVSANLRRYLKITESSSLNLNAQGGSLVVGDVPQFDMFRMGGTNSVRGFQEGGLGVGEQYLMGSAEIRSKLPFLKRFGDHYPVYDMVSMVAFSDVGQIYGQPSLDAAFGRPGYGLSVGAGIRINIPGMGPIRFDYAIPLGNDLGGNVRNIHFGVGQKF
ncbi:MAG: BamA/TamA family outer membrane protein [Cyanobacteria bacterium HKST-UBA04]|nr:BamA/TamA family outer membrane protein [Cyanobacteria bacterium HKST-UBA04]